MTHKDTTTPTKLHQKIYWKNPENDHDHLLTYILRIYIAQLKYPLKPDPTPMS